MNNSNKDLTNELVSHVIDRINDCYDGDTNDYSGLHHHAFNEDYYIIGYYQAGQWLKSHDIDAFHAINKVQDYERDNLGETYTIINSESIVNMYVFIVGEELLNELNIDLFNTNKEELIESLENLYN